VDSSAGKGIAHGWGCGAPQGGWEKKGSGGLPRWYKDLDIADDRRPEPGCEGVAVWWAPAWNTP